MQSDTIGGMNRILAVGAHPDDVEFMCAGTLFLLAELGDSVWVATLTPGDCGSNELDRPGISAVRRGEAANACRLLGAGYQCLEFDDFGIQYDTPSIRKVTALLRDTRPELVFTHPPVDYLIDHENTSRLVRTACFAGPVPNYTAPGGAAVLDHIPSLVYWSPVEGVDIFGDPTPVHFWIDVSDVIERKAAMLACHCSQRDWLRAHHGVDAYIDSMRRWAAAAGRRASAAAGRNIAFAEGFRVHRGHAYPAPQMLQPLLGERFIHVA